MIKKIISSVLIFAAVSVFSQEAKDQIGAPEAFDFMSQKFALNKSTVNSDKTILQEYVPHENLDKKEKKEEKKATKDAAKAQPFHKLTVLFVPNTDYKELLEKKMEEIKRNRNASNLEITEISSGHKVTYLDLSENAKQTGPNKTYFYKNVDSGNGFNSYVIEYFSANGKNSEESNIHLLKFAETFPSN